MKKPYHITFSADIDIESFQDFVSEVNAIEDGKDIVCYFNSKGGRLDLVPPFVHFIESNNIELVAHSEISSSGLLIFLFSNVERTILPDIFCVHHIPRYQNQELDIVNLKPIKIEKDMVEREDYYSLYGKLNDWLELTDKELNKFKKGKDLLINRLRLNNALKKSQEFFKKLA